MKKILLFFILFMVIGILALVAYFYFNPKKALQIVLPDVSQIYRVRVLLLKDTAMIDVDLAIKNKGLFKMHIDSLSYHIRLDTATLLSKNQFLGIDLARNQADTVLLPLALPYKRLMHKIKSLQGQDSVDIPIALKVIYNTVFGKTTLPYYKVLRIEVPHPPKFEIKKIEYIKRKKKTAFFIVHLTMHNYGKIDLNVSDVHYHMVVKDLFTADGSEKKIIRIRPKSTINVELPITIEFKKLFKTIGLIIRDDDQVNYQLRVTGFVQNDKLNSRKTPVEVEKSGVMELKK